MGLLRGGGRGDGRASGEVVVVVEVVLHCWCQLCVGLTFDETRPEG